MIVFVLWQDPKGKHWKFNFDNSTIVEKMERYREDLSKKKHKAYGRISMSQLLGGEHKLMEALKSGEVRQFETEDGAEMFQMVTLEAIQCEGKRTNRHDMRETNPQTQDIRNRPPKTPILLVI